MIEGFDISNNNPRVLIESWIALHDPKFCFLKASEGTTFRDKKRAEYFELIKSKGIIPGFYHFARGGNNSAVSEARNFLDAIDGFTNNGALLALDIEAQALKKNNQWIREWIATVEAEYAGKVIIYIQRSAFQSKRGCFKDNGLWLASWGDKLMPPFSIENYLLAFWQDKIVDGLDHDWFAGDIEQLKKYMCYKGVNYEVF